MSAVPKPEKLTADEYFRLTEHTEERTELIGGQIVALAQPSIEHQLISGRMFSRVDEFIQKHQGNCLPLQTIDVYLDENNTVVPDLLVICDPSKLDKKRCYGAPDWVIEITSTNRSSDFHDKLWLYREAGVREYWIIDTEKRKVWVYDFERHPNVVNFYDWTDEVPVTIYHGELTLRVADFL